MLPTEHLQELRRRIIYVLIFFSFAVVVGFAFVSRVYHYLTIPLTEKHIQLVAISPGEIVMVLLSIAAFIAIGITLPFGVVQAWRFISPGLTKKESFYVTRMIPLVILMFFAGIAFSWFFVFPTILHFLIALTLRQGLTMMIRADAYFRFMLGVTLPFGFIFEFPVVVTVATRLGVLTPHWLRKNRKYAYLAIVCMGVLISPPELISHLSVTIPTILLYEVSILLSRLAYRRRVAQAEAVA